MADGEVVPLLIVLTLLDGLLWTIGDGEVGASEDSVEAVLVQDIGYEECAVRVALGSAGGGTQAGVVRLRLRE